MDMTVSNPTERNYTLTANQVGKELRVLITAYGYEYSIASNSITVTKML